MPVQRFSDRAALLAQLVEHQPVSRRSEVQILVETAYVFPFRMIPLEAPLGEAFDGAVIKTWTVCSGYLPVIRQCPAIKGKECSNSQTRQHRQLKKLSVGTVSRRSEVHFPVKAADFFPKTDIPVQDYSNSDQDYSEHFSLSPWGDIRPHSQSKITSFFPNFVKNILNSCQKIKLFQLLRTT